LILQNQNISIYKIQEVPATSNNYDFIPNNPLPEFIFNYANYNIVNILLPNTSQGVNNGASVIIRTINGNNNYTNLYGNQT
jgi:hypothetical protein